MTIRWEDKELANKLRNMPRKADTYLSAVVRRSAPVAERYAKRNATWTDRTSNARSGLFGKSIVEPMTSYKVVVAHSVPYGIWLEVRWSGRYGIIRPTVNTQGPIVMELASRVLAEASK